MNILSPPRLRVHSTDEFSYQVEATNCISFWKKPYLQTNCDCCEEKINKSVPNLLVKEERNLIEKERSPSINSWLEKNKKKTRKTFLSVSHFDSTLWSDYRQQFLFEVYTTFTYNGWTLSFPLLTFGTTNERMFQSGLRTILMSLFL
jgi:hypothetical protein